MDSRSFSGFLMAAAMLAAVMATSAASAEGSVAEGRKLAINFCARCHVIGEYNRLGGIDSTPSFYSLAQRSDFVERLQTFYERRPHPVFVRVPGVPRWSNAPPYATPFTVEIGQIDDLIAYMRDLGDKPRPIRRRRR